MTAFYQLTDGRLMCVTETIEAGPCKLLRGYVEGVRQVTIRRADEAKPMPGAPIPGLRVVEDGE